MFEEVGYAAEEQRGTEEDGVIRVHDVFRSSDYVLCRQEPFDNGVVVLRRGGRLMAFVPTIESLFVFRVHYL
jgi:hypothetical protein